jgi:hypothetical protein
MQHVDCFPLGMLALDLPTDESTSRITNARHYFQSVVGAAESKPD